VVAAEIVRFYYFELGCADHESCCIRMQAEKQKCLEANQDKRVAEHANLPTIQNVAERTAPYMRIDTNIAASPELRASIGKPFLCIENYRWNGLIYPNGTLRPYLTKAAEI
jgi:hypothetical protein